MDVRFYLSGTVLESLGGIGITKWTDPHQAVSLVAICLNLTSAPGRRGIEDNSKIIFLIYQRKHIL